MSSSQNGGWTRRSVDIDRPKPRESCAASSIDCPPPTQTACGESCCRQPTICFAPADSGLSAKESLPPILLLRLFSLADPVDLVLFRIAYLCFFAASLYPEHVARLPPIRWIRIYIVAFRRCVV